MPKIEGRMLNYAPADEHILRRLGGAVVTQWRDFPKDVQRLIVEQATFMFDRDETVQLKQQIEKFIGDRQSVVE